MNHDFTGRTAISAAGRYIAYTACDAALTGADPRLEIIADGRSRGVFPVGSQLHFPGGVEHFELVPVDPLLQLSGSVVIGDDDIRLPIVSGTVSVIDSSVQQTIAGQQFASSLVRQAAGVLFSTIGLVCRAGQGKRAIVRRLSVSGAVGWARLYQVEGEGLTPIAQTQPKNKVINAAPGGAKSRLQVYDAASVSSPDPAPGELINWQQLAMFHTANGYISEMVQGTPYVLDPGFGLFVVAGTAAVGMGLYTEFEEIDE
jgi:hypothetical protein